MLKRHPSRPQGSTWSVPGGKLEKNEDPREAVIREVWEEVGINVADEGLQEMGRLYIRLPYVDYVFHLFRKRFVVRPTIVLELKEHLEGKWVSVPEALQLPLISGGKEALEFYVGFIA